MAHLQRIGLRKPSTVSHKEWIFISVIERAEAYKCDQLTQSVFVTSRQESLAAVSVCWTWFMGKVVFFVKLFVIFFMINFLYLWLFWLF